VTEYGAAGLEYLTVRQRGLALAGIAHPISATELREAGERASKGRSPVLVQGIICN
jgi:acyl-CoA hydrolase